MKRNLGFETELLVVLFILSKSIKLANYKKIELKWLKDGQTNYGNPYLG